MGKSEPRDLNSSELFTQWIQSLWNLLRPICYLIHISSDKSLQIYVMVGLVTSSTISDMTNNKQVRITATFTAKITGKCAQDYGHHVGMSNKGEKGGRIQIGGKNYRKTTQNSNKINTKAFGVCITPEGIPKISDCHTEGNNGNKKQWETCCNFSCCFLGQVTLNHTCMGTYAINLCNNPPI